MSNLDWMFVFVFAFIVFHGYSIDSLRNRIRRLEKSAITQLELINKLVKKL